MTLIIGLLHIVFGMGGDAFKFGFRCVIGGTVLGVADELVHSGGYFNGLMKNVRPAVILETGVRLTGNSEDGWTLEK